MLVVVVVLVVSHSGSPPPVTGGVACTAPGSPSDHRVADPSAPHGIFAFGAGKKTAAENTLVDRYLLPNPDICGATLTFQWNQIDNGPGFPARYDWSVVYQAIEPWASAGKIVNLLFSGAGEGPSIVQDDTPEYVLKQVKVITCARARPTPVLWQPGYENNWKAFIAAAVKQFADDPNVGYMRFGIGTGAEGVLWPRQIVQQPCASFWDAAGYQSEWPVYFRQMIAFMGSLHSKRQLVIGLNDGTNFPPIATEAQDAAAHGIGFGVESLTGVEADDILSGRPCDEFNWCQVFTQYTGKVPLYVQDLFETLPVGGSAIEGLLPPLLAAPLRIHVQIFEIDLADLLLTFDPGVRAYSQYHESYATAVAAAARVVGTRGGVAPVS